MITEERLAAALALLLYDAHPTAANTAGQTLTAFCMVNTPYPWYDWAGYDLLSKPLREFMNENPEFDLDEAKRVLKVELMTMLDESEW